MIKSANSKTLLQAPKLHGLYHLDNELAKQLSQRPIIGPSEQAQPRRSERIRLQHEKNSS